MHPLRHHLFVSASLAAVFCVAGCGERSDDDTVGQAARSARQEARESAASGAAVARRRAGELASTTRSAAPGGDTNVMGAARDARQQAYGTDPNTTPGSAERGRVDDARITSMVLRGLKADKELNPLRIDVDANDGVVTLSGAVPTAAARARAGEIARNVKDVKSVNDQLTVNAS